MSEEELQNDGPIIPEEHFREAIAACRQDPELDRYFKFAPPGARLFIGLSFYSTHFGEKTDTAQYKVCLAEIEPSLTVNDIKYLLRFERDKETKKYLRELLERREAEEALDPGVDTTQDTPTVTDASCVAPTVADTTRDVSGAEEGTPSKKKGGRKLRGLGASVKSLKLVAEDEAPVPQLPVVPIAIGIGVVAFFIVLFLGYSRVKVGRQLEQRNADVANLQRRIGELQQELDRTRSELRKVRSATQVKDESSRTQVVRADEPVPRDDVEQNVVSSAPVIDEEAVATDETRNETNVVKKVDAVRSDVKVVFTDGRSIVRKAGGKLVEVPRSFSYSGAGLKKPFWIYDRKLGDAKMEVEAKLEKQARDTWRTLAEEARRQGEGTLTTSGM